jgi:protein MpaA
MNRKKLSSTLKIALHRLTRKHLLYIGSGAFLLFIIVNMASFFVPRTVSFSYSSKTCFTNPTLLPELLSKKGNADYQVNTGTSLAILGYPVYSQTTCIKPLKAPQEKTVSAVPFGNDAFAKQIRIITGDQPSVQSLEPLAKPLAARLPLKLKLTRTDVVFDYQLEANSRKTDCDKQGASIHCDISKLGLAQSTPYQFSLKRVFKKSTASTVFTKSQKTVEAVRITATSIAGGGTFYNVPTEVTLTANKPIRVITKASLHTLDGKNMPIKTSVKGAVLTVSFTEALLRSTTFELVVEDIASHDGGYLPAPYVLAFNTSGGPKVIGVSIGSSRVQPGSSVTLTFDSGVSGSQPLGNFIQVLANGSPVAASIANSGRSVTVNPEASLPRCATITVRVLDGLQNEFGISGGSSWQYKSRVLCQTVFSLGSSVQGRSITAYSFGSGGTKIIFVGGTHGNEKSSVYILNRWVDALESNPDRIPAHLTIVVIPNLNPDGYAVSSRTNANNVDLNRNFPASNWKAGVTMPDKSYLEYGGGTSPLSEPESRALANFIRSQSPRLVLTYHASGAVVVPNGSGDSDSLAHLYDRNSRVGYLAPGGTETFFEYDTTGAFEDWLHESLGAPALLIELSTKTGSEFGGHQNAMWLMLKQ